MDQVCKVGDVDAMLKLSKLKWKQFIESIYASKNEEVAIQAILHKVPSNEWAQSVIKDLLRYKGTLISLQTGEIALALTFLVTINHPLKNAKGFTSNETALYQMPEHDGEDLVFPCMICPFKLRVTHREVKEKRETAYTFDSCARIHRCTRTFEE